MEEVRASEVRQATRAVPPHVELQYNPMIPPYQGDPFPSYRWLRENAPLNYVEMLDAWMVTRYDDVVTVAADPERFSSRRTVPWLNEWLAAGSPEFVSAMAGCVAQGRFMLGEDPPEHTSLRSIASKAFGGRRINALRTWLAQLAEDLLTPYVESGGVELVWDFGDPFASRALFQLLGAPDADFQQLRAWAQDILLMDNPMIPESDRLAAARRWSDCDAYIMQLISERRESPQDDMISDLVHTADRDGQRMSDEDIVFFFRGLCVGGIHTSRIAITNTMHSMLADRRHWERACADSSVIPEMLEESLRRDAPIRGLLRTTTTEVELGGVTLPAGALLLVLYDAANRDPNRFPEPDAFLPGRANVREHVAFGHGPHRCIGAHLGRMQARIALTVLAQKLPNMHLASGYEPTYLPDFFFRGLDRLGVTW